MPFLADYQNLVKSHKMMLRPSVSSTLSSLDANKEPHKFIGLRKAAVAEMTKYNDELAKQISAEKDKGAQANLTKYKAEFVKQLELLKKKVPPAPPRPPAMIASTLRPKAPPAKSPVATTPVATGTPVKPIKFLGDYQALIRKYGQLVESRVSGSLRLLDSNRDGSKAAALCQAAATAMTKYNDTLTAQVKAELDDTKKQAMSKFGADFLKLLQAVKAHK